MATSNLSARLLYRRWQERAAPVCGCRPTVANLPNHSVKMNLCPRQDEDDIAGLIAQILEFKANDARLAILLFNRFEGKGLRVDQISLCMSSGSLCVWHFEYSFWRGWWGSNP